MTDVQLCFNFSSTFLVSEFSLTITREWVVANEHIIIHIHGILLPLHSFIFSITLSPSPLSFSLSLTTLSLVFSIIISPSLSLSCFTINYKLKKRKTKRNHWHICFRQEFFISLLISLILSLSHTHTHTHTQRHRHKHTGTRTHTHTHIIYVSDRSLIFNFEWAFCWKEILCKMDTDLSQSAPTVLRRYTQRHIASLTWNEFCFWCHSFHLQNVYRFSLTVHTFHHFGPRILNTRIK